MFKTKQPLGSDIVSIETIDLELSTKNNKFIAEKYFENPKNKHELKLLINIDDIDSSSLAQIFGALEMSKHNYKNIVLSLEASPSCFINIKDAAIIAKALRNSKITELCFSNLQLIGDVALIIFSALEHPDCNITSLRLNYPVLTPETITTITQALRHENCKVYRCSWHSSDINDWGAEQISNVLTDPNCKIESIHLHDDSVTDAGILKLAKSLTYPNNKIVRLILSSTKMSRIGITTIASVLEHENCKVTHLELKSNNTNHTDIIKIIEASTKRNLLKSVRMVPRLASFEQLKDCFLKITLNPQSRIHTCCMIKSPGHTEFLKFVNDKNEERIKAQKAILPLFAKEKLPLELLQLAAVTLGARRALNVQS